MEFKLTLLISMPTVVNVMQNTTQTYVNENPVANNNPFLMKQSQSFLRQCLIYIHTWTLGEQEKYVK